MSTGSHEAAASNRSLVVSVEAGGVCAGVRLTPAAMEWSAEELASRIVRLNALADLKRQGDIGVEVPGVFVPTSAQIAGYERTIDF